MYGYDGIARGIPFSLGVISGEERMKADVESGKHFMQTKDFDCARISCDIITAVMNHQA